MMVWLYIEEPLRDKRRLSDIGSPKIIKIIILNYKLGRSSSVHQPFFWSVWSIHERTFVLCQKKHFLVQKVTNDFYDQNLILKWVLLRGDGLVYSSMQLKHHALSKRECHQFVYWPRGCHVLIMPTCAYVAYAHACSARDECVRTYVHVYELEYWCVLSINYYYQRKRNYCGHCKRYLNKA